MKKTAEMVIIGGGISGLSTAFNLASRGMKDIVLLEKGFLMSGSTGRCGAGVRMQWGTEMNCALSKATCEIFENINEILDFEGDTEFEQGGYLLMAITEKEEEQFKKNIELQHSLGIPSELLTPQEALDIVPDLNIEGIRSCAFCAKDGHANPFRTMQAYAEAAQRHGVEIYTYTEATGIDVVDGKVKGVETNRGYISTDKILIAAGAWSQHVGELAGVKVPVRPERHEILVTEPVNRKLEPMIMSFAGNIYLQQEPGGEFIMGFGPEPHESYSTLSTWEFVEEMCKKAYHYLPYLKNIRIVRQWAGLYEMSPDAQPILGKAEEVEGIYLATGFSGHGFMFGPITGQLMAEYILGLPTTLPIDKLDVGRFDRGELIFEPAVV
ncbi:MAG TPA: FAD-binding oxidoreductase [Thermoanaerobacterales bacterium]|jgi:sarcosine oxidase subunit beta|nr:FAD-binding oxidoreductase [Thermoanaerobacterales bacterium]